MRMSQSVGPVSSTRPAPRRGIAIALLAIAVAALAVSPARAERPRIYAITGAHVIVAPGKSIENGTVVMRDGLIEAVGSDLKPPADAVVVDGKGKTVHAGFIDPCSDVGVRKSEPAMGGGAAGP